MTSLSGTLSVAPTPAVPRWRAAVAGAVSALAAIAVGELVAGLLVSSSLLAAVGQVFIDAQPPGAKDFVVGLFGQNDKLAFETLIVVVAAAIGAVLGLVARRWFWVGAAGIGLFALAGLAATLRDPATQPTIAVIVAGAAALAGIASLSWLLGPRSSRSEPARLEADAATPDWSRRGFLIRSGGVFVGSLVVGFAGRTLIEQNRIPPDLAGEIPPPVETAALPPDAELDVPAITPLVVPNPEFYRIDTALLTPRVDVASWRLKVHGMVDREVNLAFGDLVELPLFEQYVTIACVSNEVGGRLVGNAKWTGVHLRQVLDMAGVHPDASQLVGRSVDGFTAGMPTDWVMNQARDPMIAVLMNDEPLPQAHGFPARLIVPGLYGYVSATKWLSDLELTTLEAFDGYWVPLGWAKEAPILTQSRIDTPRDGSTVPAGRIPVAGVAWAPDRGVTKVEVQVDGGEWQAATLSTPISDATWVQWMLPWDAAAGSHVIAVRATDGTGSTQTADRTPPAPDGARGYHRIDVAVS
jgi:DMSO/TMAO reductase YedYZ molybdopterin-dependent catalytic subunit